MKARRSTWLLATLAVLTVLLAMEVVARLARTVHDDIFTTDGDALDSWFVHSPELGWENKPGFTGFAEGGDWREFDAEGFLAVDSAQIADTATPKVLFIGDSNTFGYGVPTESSFVEVVDQLLPGVSAINLAVAGYSSYQGRLALQRHLERLNPAVVVASFNFNDRRAVLPGESESDGQAYFERVHQARNSTLNRIGPALERIHLYRALRYVLRRLGLAQQRTREYSLAELVPRVTEQKYRDNLREIAKAARERGIPVVFLLLRDNPLDTDGVYKGLAASAAGDHDAAIEYFKAVIRSRPWFGYLAKLQLAREYDLKGDPARAAEALHSRDSWSDFDGGRSIRLDTTYNDIMREVAREQGAELVDGARVLYQDPHVYIDNCHFNAIGHRRVGELLAQRISRLLPVEGTTPARRQRPR